MGMASAVTVISFAVTALLTKRFATAAARAGVLDVPNARSSHDRPVPRAGGAVFAIVVLAALVADALNRSDVQLAAIGGAALLIAGIGLLDDVRALSVPTRLGVQLIAAVVVVWAVGGLEQIRFGDSEVELGAAGNVLAVLWIVWLTNLYNFMDGIDGLAGVEALATAAGITLLALLFGVRVDPVLLAIIGGVAGFLIWNWAPARIFMGDTGSGFLGFALAALALRSEVHGSIPLLIWVLLLSVFVVDATATLLRRLLQGERIYSAHRQHAYQRAAAALHSHARVSRGVAIIDGLLVLAAWSAMRYASLAMWIACAAIGALLIAWYVVVHRFEGRGVTRAVESAS